MQEKKQDNRSYCWATVVYQESAPDKWQEIVSEAKVPVFISPLHDKDTNGTGEEPKKAHWHILAMFSTKKSKEQAQEFFASFGGVGVERVRERRAYSRYLCHLDNPEKAQYDTSEVVAFYADYMEVIGLPSDKYEVLQEVIDFIEKNDIKCYSTLVRFARKYNPRWFRVLCDSSTLLLTEYIKSRKWAQDNFEAHEYDKVVLSEFGVVENESE